MQLAAVGLWPLRLLTPCLLCCSVLPAQTADRSAIPPGAATTAPAAHGGTYSVSNGELIVAPGLRIPNGNVPWALDTVAGKQTLVPVHHAALSQSSSKAVLDGAATPTPLHADAIFFLHTSDRTENTGDASRGTPTGWAIVQVKAEGNTRTVERVGFNEVSAVTVCTVPVICSNAEALPGGWLRITPRSPLPPGEYALVPVQRTSTSSAPVLYNFIVGAEAASPRDAVAPGQNLDTTTITKTHHNR